LSFGVSEIQFMWFPSETTGAVVGLANWSKPQLAHWAPQDIIRTLDWPPQRILARSELHFRGTNFIIAADRNNNKT
jgi:hypothetical protein